MMCMEFPHLIPRLFTTTAKPSLRAKGITGDTLKVFLLCGKLYFNPRGGAFFGAPPQIFENLLHYLRGYAIILKLKRKAKRGF